MSDMDCDVSVTCLSHTCQQKWSNIDSSHGAYPCQTQQTDSLVWSVKIVFFLPSKIWTKGTIFFQSTVYGFGIHAFNWDRAFQNEYVFIRHEMMFFSVF